MNRKWQALGRLKTGEMNRTEAAYAARLDLLRNAGEIVWWKFEGIKLRLADATFYTPDFAVLRADMTLELHEVKGHWTDDARAKTKIAASQFPIRIIAVRKTHGGWETEEF